MTRTKIIKAGTKVLLKYACNFVGCDGEEEYELTEDMTENELNDLAYEQAVENVGPEGWFELSDEGEMQ